MTSMPWTVSHRFDRGARPLADRHYNRQTPGSPQFVPPGKCVVLVTADRSALWCTSWPKFAQHEWVGAWINTLFRRESGPLASELIRAAVAATRHLFGEPPSMGMVTFVDAAKVRRKRDPGRCYLRAGFRFVGTTRGGLIVLQMLPGEMPEASEPYGLTLDLALA
jgi:hypothetical protein